MGDVVPESFFGGLKGAIFLPKNKNKTQKGHQKNKKSFFGGLKGAIFYAKKNKKNTKRPLWPPKRGRPGGLESGRKYLPPDQKVGERGA